MRRLKEMGSNSAFWKRFLGVKKRWVEAPYQFWVSNSNLCQKKRTVDCRTWKVKRNKFGFSEGLRVLMSEYWGWDLH